MSTPLLHRRRLMMAARGGWHLPEGWTVCSCVGNDTGFFGQSFPQYSGTLQSMYIKCKIVRHGIGGSALLTSNDLTIYFTRARNSSNPDGFESHFMVVRGTANSADVSDPTKLVVNYTIPHDILSNICEIRLENGVMELTIDGTLIATFVTPSLSISSNLNILSIIYTYGGRDIQNVGAFYYAFEYQTTNGRVQMIPCRRPGGSGYRGDGFDAANPNTQYGDSSSIPGSIFPNNSRISYEE